LGADVAILELNPSFQISQELLYVIADARNVGGQYK
jgi:hypothetical protein